MNIPFDIGDRVRVKSRFNAGREGTITRIDYLVQIDDNGGRWIYPADKLEKVDKEVDG